MRRYLHQWLRSRSSLVVFALPILLAVVGPFGTYSDLTFTWRLLYWAVLVYGIGACMIISIAFFLSERPKISNKIIGVLLGSALAAIPGALLVYGLRATMRPQALDPALFSPVKLWAEVWFLGVIISFAEVARVKMFQQEGISPAPAPDLTPTNFDKDPKPDTSRAPPNVAVRTELHSLLDFSDHHPEDIVSLSMQDHYVEVTSDQGKSLVLMRMVDAIAALKGLDGHRIHRSHWVANSHMRSLSREQKRVFLTLSDGRKLPVSKTYLANVSAYLGQQEEFV